MAAKLGVLLLLFVAAPLMSSARSTLQDATTSSAPSGVTNCSSSGDAASFACAVPPCSIWPCLPGWTGVDDYCRCRCNCSSPPGAPPLSVNITGDGAAGADAGAAATAVNSTSANGTCGRLYQPCTCSAQCCGKLVCGFPLRGPLARPDRAAADAAVAAAVAELARELAVAANQTYHSTLTKTMSSSSSQNHSVASASSSNTSFDSANSSTATLPPAGASVSAAAATLSKLLANNLTAMFVETGGPSCRPLNLLELRSGVVEYGC